MTHLVREEIRIHVWWYVSSIYEGPGIWALSKCWALSFTTWINIKSHFPLNFDYYDKITMHFKMILKARQINYWDVFSKTLRGGQLVQFMPGFRTPFCYLKENKHTTFKYLEVLRNLHVKYSTIKYDLSESGMIFFSTLCIKYVWK